MLDSKGVIKKSRHSFQAHKSEFATDRNIDTLVEAMKDADVFVGLSQPNIVNQSMLLSMAKDPIVFAMANPTPEIDYKLACQTRADVIMATGKVRSPQSSK